jgi:hypothetical protein
MQIEIVDIEGMPGDRKIALDGEVIEGSRVRAGMDGLRVNVFDSGAVARLRMVNAGLETLSAVAELILGIDMDREKLMLSAVFTAQSPARFRYNVHVQLAEWANPWSFVDLTETVSGLAEDYGFKFVSSEFSGSFQLWVDHPLDHWRNVGSYLDEFDGPVRTLLSAAVQQLSHRTRGDVLLAMFDFPPAIRIACEQYLLYFIQFLRDIGIEAEAELEQDDEHVLFSVSPKDGAEALERIKDALDAYLDLPNSPAVLAHAGSDVAVQQLRANVMHLQGQLALASAIIQAKDATIEALNIGHYRYKQLVYGTATETGSVSPSASAPADSEPLIHGAVELQKYEGKGFSIDLPNILRKLKRK